MRAAVCFFFSSPTKMRPQGRQVWAEPRSELDGLRPWLGAPGPGQLAHKVGRAWLAWTIVRRVGGSGLGQTRGPVESADLLTCFFLSSWGQAARGQAACGGAPPTVG